MNEERTMVLEMLAAGKITIEQANQSPGDDRDHCRHPDRQQIRPECAGDDARQRGCRADGQIHAARDQHHRHTDG